MPAWTRLDTVLLVAVSAVAAAVRLVGLGYPAELVFDEIFYAQNACLLVAGPDVCGVAEPLSNAHPPLGQWLIAIGIAVAGYDPFGWRIASVAGRASRPWPSRTSLPGSSSASESARLAAVGATVAAGLLAIDVLHLVQSRIAMLDVFLAMFVVAAFVAVILDLRSAPRPGRGGIGQWLFGRPWRLAAGVLIGCAVAVKWSGVYSALGRRAPGRWLRRSSLGDTMTPGARRGWGAAFGAAFRAEGLRTVGPAGRGPASSCTWRPTSAWPRDH